MDPSWVVASSWTLRGWSPPWTRATITLHGWSPPWTRATVTLRGLKSPSTWLYDSTAYRNHANAIVGIRFSTSNIAQGASEPFVYGTAVIVDPVMPKLPDPFPQAE